ncbi:MAG TPA: CBS domain-containing protein [Steroidobacteraceae bacterium]|nr:CBS domain-containing protein [Steroidobacteraceae bacterium]
MLVGEICNRNAVVVASDADLVTAAQLMRTQHVGFLVVTAGGAERSTPLGVLTDRDIVVEVVSKGVDPLQLKVEDAMSRDPLVISVEARPEHALRQMRTFGVRRTPVVDASGRLIGVLALDDLLDWLAGALSDAAGIVRRGQRIERQMRA